MANALSDTRSISYGSPYDRRNLKDVWQGVKDAYINSIQAAPEWLLEQMAPQDRLTPGELYETPRGAVRSLGLHREQDIAQRRQDIGRDYEQGLDYGTGLGMIADPYIDGPFALAGAIGKFSKLANPAKKARGNALGGLIANERGAIDAYRRGLLEREYEAAADYFRKNPEDRKAFRHRNKLQHELNALAAEEQKYVPAKSDLAEDYRGQHQAPTRDGGGSGHDLTDIYPDDIYGVNGAQYYGHFGQNDPMDVQSISLIRSMKGNPKKKVTIYRAVPKNVEGGIQKQDWVTINRQYAKDHGESALQGDYKIIKKTVPADDIFTNGDSIHEWGYDPK